MQTMRVRWCEWRRNTGTKKNAQIRKKTLLQKHFFLHFTNQISFLKQSHTHTHTHTNFKLDLCPFRHILCIFLGPHLKNCCRKALTASQQVHIAPLTDADFPVLPGRYGRQLRRTAGPPVTSIGVPSLSAAFVWWLFDIVVFRWRDMWATAPGPGSSRLR